MDACQRIPELAAELNWPIAIQLDSREARDYREWWERHKRIEEEAKHRPRKPTAQELFDGALVAARSDWRHWRDLAWELQRGEDGGDFVAASADPTKKYRWQACTEIEKEQILECARAFLVNATPAQLAERSDDWNAVCMAWALWLVKDWLNADEELRAAVTGKWSEALFAQPFHGVSEEQILTGIGVALDPARAAECLRNRLFLATSGKVGMANILSSFESAWIPTFSPILIDFLTKQKVTGFDLHSAIKFLTYHDTEAARAWLDEQLKSTTPNDLSTTAALALALFPDEMWQQARSSIAANSGLATTSLQTLADLYAGSADLLNTLSAAHLGELFILLEATFSSLPPISIEGDDKSPRERLEALRNSIPKRLESLASNEACRQLSYLAGEVPHWRTLLRRHLRDTRLAVLRNSWSGVPPDVLSAMADKHERRWVRSEDDLQELIMESIQRFQDGLTRTQYPTVADLWNEKPLSPKHESVLTQKLVGWLADDLDKNGAALGCQVKPSRIHETDIEVRAQLGGAAPTGHQFLVTIEVKRSFNREVATSLEDQLVTEYLLKLGRTHGIYVVGWYKGGRWKPENNRLKAQTYSEACAAVSILRDTSKRKVGREFGRTATLRLVSTIRRVKQSFGSQKYRRVDKHDIQQLCCKSC